MDGCFKNKISMVNQNENTCLFEANSNNLTRIIILNMVICISCQCCIEYILLFLLYINSDKIIIIFKMVLGLGWLLSINERSFSLLMVRSLKVQNKIIPVRIWWHKNCSQSYSSPLLTFPCILYPPSTPLLQALHILSSPHHLFIHIDVAAADMDPEISRATKCVTVHSGLQHLAWNESSNNCV